MFIHDYVCGCIRLRLFLCVYFICSLQVSLSITTPRIVFTIYSIYLCAINKYFIMSVSLCMSIAERHCLCFYIQREFICIKPQC